MNTQRTITILLGLAVIVGLITFAVRSNNRAMIDDTAQEPVGVPVEQPVDNPVSASPVTDGASVAKGYQFDQSVTFRLNEQAVFPDELQVRLKEINDSRCKDGVVCIWAGEISGVFLLTGGKLAVSKEIRLGTMTNKSVVEGNYTFTLKSATTNTMTIVVTNNKINTASCYVGGCSSQICYDQEGVASTCEYREEYACYQTATCERQSSGQCGWTETPALKACLYDK